MPIKKVSKQGSTRFYYVGGNNHTICGLNYFSWSASLMKHQAVSDVNPPGKVLCDICHTISVALHDEEELYS